MDTPFVETRLVLADSTKVWHTGTSKRGYLRAVGPATVLSHKCDILFIEGRPNCARQSLASTLSAPGVARHCPVIPVAMQMSLSLFAYPRAQQRVPNAVFQTKFF